MAGFDESMMAYSGEWPRSRTYWHSLAEVAQNKTVILLWKGNQHLAQHLIAGPERFDFVSSTDPSLSVDETALLVPEDALRAQLSRGKEELDNIFKLLKAKAAQVIFAGTPPPKGDIGFLREVLARERHFRTAMESAGVDASTVELSPLLLQYKLWLLLQDIYRLAAEEHGVFFLPSPASAQDEDGFLRRELWAEDATHANIDYGKLLVADVERYLNEASATQAQDLNVQFGGGRHASL
ncbi:hypothetical protein [Pararhizobium gei]|uniref:hypothetical protein n=1 Tax=Pararhizobium gei TaxID=1395951 RepID=UPI0023DA8A54|nr:hypothetical protein [Rhizobium gei]